LFLLFSTFPPDHLLLDHQGDCPWKHYDFPPGR
jgi:hypothetical protein